MIAGAAFCAALFLFSGAMLAREYLDQKQSAEAFEEVAELIKEDVELPALELENAPATEEVTAFEKYADVYAKNSDLVGWVSIPGTRIDYPVMQTKDSPDFYLNPTIRKYLAERAELVGAIRLPNTAFKDNAGTEVTADILFLQKRERKIDIEPDWVHLGVTGDGIAVNTDKQYDV